jgi:hypothetical protein
MNRFLPGRRRGGPFPTVSGLAVAGILLLGGGLAPVAVAAPPVPPYPEAVDRTRQAANAVLARSGDEACLRGKLTNALLGLSASCKASAESGELCGLARSAAVVTPMSLRFMDDTSRRLLELTSP